MYMRFTPNLNCLQSKCFVFFGACSLLAIPATSSAAQCGYWVTEAGYIANGQRGDILLTRVEGSPAGAVTDPLGQYYTHAGMLLNPYQVRHNTASYDQNEEVGFWDNVGATLIGAFDAPHCYSFGKIPEIRQGQPGLGTNSVSDLPQLKPWNTSELYLLKPKDEGSFRAGASVSADFLETVIGQTYDVHSYMDYEGAIAANRSMCSGSVKHATDLAGYGGFNLVTYSPEQVTTSAKNLFEWVYRKARATVDSKFSTVGSMCREYLATGVANAVVSCFADGSCDRGSPQTKGASESRWAAAQLGSAVSISPDNLVYDQPGSLYGAVVRADFHPRTERYVSYTCDLGSECQSGSVSQCPNSASTRYCYNGSWTPCSG
jgi:hypothetical protein